MRTWMLVVALGALAPSAWAGFGRTAVERLAGVLERQDGRDTRREPRGRGAGGRLALRRASA